MLLKWELLQAKKNNNVPWVMQFTRVMKRVRRVLFSRVMEDAIFNYYKEQLFFSFSLFSFFSLLLFHFSVVRTKQHYFSFLFLPFSLRVWQLPFLE
jgi:hypothetical protein